LSKRHLPPGGEGSSLDGLEVPGWLDCARLAGAAGSIQGIYGVFDALQFALGLAAVLG